MATTMDMHLPIAYWLLDWALSTLKSTLTCNCPILDKERPPRFTKKIRLVGIIDANPNHTQASNPEWQLGLQCENTSS